MYEDVDKHVKEAEVQIRDVQKRLALYYNLRNDLEKMVGDLILLKKHFLILPP